MSTTPASKEEDCGGEGDATAAKVQRLEEAKEDPGGKAEEARPPWPWKKAKKAVIMMSFSGKDYLGMQR